MGSVRASIIGRPRRLPAHRRAHHLVQTYPLNREELIMEKPSPQHNNEVWDKVNGTSMNGPSVEVLRNHVPAIAIQLNEVDSFDRDGRHWVLSNRVWDTWPRTTGLDRYLK